ncbi:MAG: PASTA domain-containing protein [Clostridia bacterium]|nr:PASTA domain-containing protein [Clostridia bacterium]
MQLSDGGRHKRIRIIAWGILACFGFLALRIFYLQVVRGSWLVSKALNQWTHNSVVEATRGSIRDCNGEILAQSGSASSVLLYPKLINGSTDADINEANARFIAEELSKLLEMSEDTIYKKCVDTTKYEIWLKRQITPEQEEAILKLDLTGVGLAVDTKRYYPKGNFLTQIIGFTSVDGDGIEGIEAYYDKYLAGEDGQKTVQTDLGGREIAFGDEYYVAPTDGYDVYLTIDYVIQSYIEKAAGDAYERYKASSVMCVVMNPKTGAILGLTIKPDYDLNDPPRNDTEVLAALTRNQVFANSNDPGSVFKVFTLAAALDAGVTTVNECFACRGGRDVAGGFVRCDNNHGDNVSLATGLAKSCNSVFVDLALRMGTDKFYNYIRAFGFGKKTGVDFLSEASGILIDESNVKEGDLARIGFGQSISATPIQTIKAFCEVINGGVQVTPHLLSKVVDKDGTVILEENTQTYERVISEQTSEIMRSLLKGVVDNGSGSRAAVAGYSIGGKTGTAQKYAADGTIKTTHLSSFIACAPVDDPQVAVLFIVDEATDAESDYGSLICAPYVGEILEETLQYMGITPHYTAEELATMGSLQVPNVVGKTKSDAIAVLKGKGLVPYISGPDNGIVVEQMPAAGEVVPKGEQVAITLKTKDQLGPVEMVEVPNLKGKTIE